MDGDGLPNECDPDADGDGVLNTVDKCWLHSDPLNRDDDGDGFGNNCDICPSVSDPNQSDWDGIHAGDACTCGDVDGNGALQQNDIDVISAWLLDPNLPEPSNCDTDDDDDCDSTDKLVISFLIQAQAGKGTCDLYPDSDDDHITDPLDFCPFWATATGNNIDNGGMAEVMTPSGPDGIGDFCQCGDVTADGHVDVWDNFEILMYMLAPTDDYWLTHEWTAQDLLLCDIDQNDVCEDFDREKGTHGYPGTYGYIAPPYTTHPGCLPYAGP